uniref:Uncharacterized protein n=1 Tax=Tanacetum cinerariifolium TaxID=118510 RepID=A0A6L2JXK3_TANCI|nr:hypothetical protein [Tanacetum cinerariifolium]
MGRFTYSQLNKKSFENIQALYLNEHAMITDFVPIGSENDERRIRDMNKKAERESSDKGEVDYAVLDKRYPIVDWKSEFFHNDRYGKPHDYYRVFRADRSSRYIKTFTEMVSKFDRHMTGNKAYLANYQKINDGGFVAFGSSRGKITGIGLAVLTGLAALVDAATFGLAALIERRYPLTKETLERMISLRLIAESENEAVFDLLRFIQKQIDEM